MAGDSLTLDERVALNKVRSRFDPEQDGTGIGEIATEDLMFMADFVVGNPNSGISRDYIARIQARDLGIGG